MTSYDAYEELLGKAQKGLEFYKKLSHNVGQLLTRLRGTCQVQQEERAQMLSKQTPRRAQGLYITLYDFLRPRGKVGSNSVEGNEFVLLILSYVFFYYRD